jgi:hypothetical protein
VTPSKSVQTYFGSAKQKNHNYIGINEMLNKSLKLLTSLIITTTLCISSAYANPEIGADYDIKQYENFNDDGDIIILCVPYPLCKERVTFKKNEKISSVTIQGDKSNVEIPFAR